MLPLPDWNDDGLCVYLPDDDAGLPDEYAGSSERRRLMNLRISQMPIIASSAITMMFDIMPANASPMPKCDSSAAMPRPAARPAIGPSQRERFGAAGAGCGAFGCMRCACDGAACCIGCCAGGVACRCVTVED